jgi:diketogulonate reductase-like aldo/keto reductase
MEAVHAEGLAKSIGVSNFTVEDLKILLPTAKVIPSVNQLELHPCVYLSNHLVRLIEGVLQLSLEGGGADREIRV